MFADEFFPSPIWVIDRLLEPYRGRMGHRRQGRCDIATILEPEAGDGRIVAAMTREGGYHSNPRVLAIEPSPELVAILRTRKCEVVASDFLTYTPEHRIDLIVMNPPFSNGDEHLLHAWNILKHGEIACVLPEYMVKNPNTKRKELMVSIIEQHGSVEDLGPAFEDADRKTKVAVCIVRLKKVGNPNEELAFDFKVESDEKESGFQGDVYDAGSGVAMPDQMGAMIRRFEMSKEAFKDLLKAKRAVQFFTGGVCTKDGWEIATKALERAAPEEAYEMFKDQIRAGFWEGALKLLGIEKLLTSKVREKFKTFVEQQGQMALTKENIAQVYDTLFLNRKMIMQGAIEQVFDHMTKYHEENQVHVEGWKSNESFKVSRKVVLPFYISDGYKPNPFRINSNRHTEASDIDKVMCYLSGKNYEEIVEIYKAVERIQPGSNLGESTFFKIRAYKKGTIHLEFLDEKLWNRFNIKACQGKGWIGKEAG